MNQPAVIWVDLEEDKCSPMETEWHTVKYIEASVVEDLRAAERAKSAKLVTVLETIRDKQPLDRYWESVFVYVNDALSEYVR